MTNVDRLAALVGSKSTLAEICGVDPATVTRWNMPSSTTDKQRHRGNDGRIPVRFNRRIREWASSCGQTPDNWMVLMDCLDPAVCPTCGHAVDEDRVF